MDEHPFFESRFRVGVEHIDGEHKKLFEILGRVDDALMANDFSAGPIIRSAVAELLECTGRHFANEEAIMEAAAYPDLEAHRAAHRKLLENVRDMEIGADFGSQFMPSELAAFLYDWLADHILVEDMAFGAFCRDRERETSGASAA